MVSCSTGSGVYPVLCSSGLAEPSLQQYQENAGYAPLYEVVDPPQARTGGASNDPQAQMEVAPNEGTQNISAPERLRRHAMRYVSNPDSTVSDVHLKPGPSGRIHVIIMIDTHGILGDTTN